MNLETCLPEDLRGPSTVITRIAAGLSGAGVYRVESAGRTFVLKVSGADESIDNWRRRIHLQQLAAEAGVTPRVVHTDEEQRAVVTAFVIDQSFPALYGDPRTRASALAQLGRTIRRLHEIVPSTEVTVSNPLEFLAQLWAGPLASLPLPSFVGETVREMLAEEAPARERDLVLSHNDVNPTNIAYDGESILLLDWDTVGLNDHFYDLAVPSVFFRMDDDACRALLSAYEGEPVVDLPARFLYTRRLAATLCGIMFLHLARHAGHAGAGGDETLESTPSLGECFQRMFAGVLNVGSAEGQWMFGLALIKESLAFG